MQNYTLFIIFAKNTDVKRDELDKRYYKINEVAEIIGLPAPTLRYWESQFTILRPKRNNNGVRLYTSRDIETIRMLHYLVKEKGLKLSAAQEQLRINREGITRKYDAIKRLREIRAELVKMLEALDRKRAD